MSVYLYQGISENELMIFDGSLAHQEAGTGKAAKVSVCRHACMYATAYLMVFSTWQQRHKFR
jgi:hypothetical protein